MARTATTITVAAGGNEDIAERINAAFASGSAATVNGRKITSRFGRPPAVAYLNGTIAVTVEGREKRTTGTVYAKKGQTLTVA